MNGVIFAIIPLVPTQGLWKNTIVLLSGSTSNDTLTFSVTWAISALWLPPPSVGSGGENDIGYGVYDHFNLGEPRFHKDWRCVERTKYGTKQQLHDAIVALHSHEISVYADAVLNHKLGGDLEDGYWQAIRVEAENRMEERGGDGWERGIVEARTWTKFDFGERHGEYSQFQWHAKHFDSVDSVFSLRQNGVEFTEANRYPDDSPKYVYRFLFNEPGWIPLHKKFEDFVSCEKGNYDYLTGVDLDYNRFDVRQEMKYWGQWLVSEMGFDGFRIDAVKHIDANFIREWLGHVRAQAGKPLFAMAEYLDGNVAHLHDYIRRVSAEGPYPQDVSLLDFALFFKIKSAGQQGPGFQPT